MISAIASFMGTLGMVAQLFGPAKYARVGELLGLGGQLISQGEAGADALHDLTDDIQAMVAEGRDPTDDEWSALKARSDAAHAAIQAYDPDADA